jgi:glycosyltransferase involved in cell wall biosynthesis
MRKEDIKISVGMPVYNGEPYLEEAIKSVLKQTYRNFEFIISDNASTDRTEEICRDFACRDTRINYIRNCKNIGAANNYNQLFRKSSGEYFRWFNADDLCSELSHELCLAVMEANPDAVMCYGKTDIIDGQGNLIEHYDDNLDLRMDSAAERFFEFFKAVGLTNAIYGLMRRSALGKTLLMGDGSFPAADTNLMVELALHGKIIEIPKTLFFRRMHEQASSWDRTNQNVQQEFWKGKSSRFVMPTLKKEYAFWRAINKCPALGRDKLRMKKFIFQRMIWARRTITQEMFQAFLGTFYKS